MKAKHPLLIAIPHSSNLLPAKTWDNVNLSKQEVEHYLDIGSQELYDLESFHTLPAKYSRLYCDLNRAPDHQSTSKNRKGVILKTTYRGKKIYKSPLTEAQKVERIRSHQRYFKKLKEYIQTHEIKFLISAHTMGHLLNPKKEIKKEKPDICLSNNYFVSCDANTTHELKTFLKKEGYTVSINDPFRGAYLLNYFCHRNRLPGLQMEFNFTLIGDSTTQKLEAKKVKMHKKKIQNALLKFYINCLK